jgi:hypothetical protein
MLYAGKEEREPFKVMAAAEIQGLTALFLRLDVGKLNKF